MPPYSLYYSLKPWIPWRFRHLLKSYRARWLLKSCGDVWPIKQSAGIKPDGWPGWPEGKQFSFVLTHDVESKVGLQSVRELAELEMSLGFRSTFNFVPEGEYRVPPGLRQWLTENGFEVGIHGLHHDGKLYASAELFTERAQRINRYLKEWNVEGFRSPFMHHNLRWLHLLNIAYDSSTFDTDPFEPQPDDVNTIFPYWVSLDGNGKYGYVELPYTLVQDFTLFVVLGYQTNDVWKTKLNWLVQNGGMVFFDTHPDYMAMRGEKPRSGQYPVSLYSDFLKHVRSCYEGHYWQARAKDVASWYRETSHRGEFDVNESPDRKLSLKESITPRIWIDLDNTPHVPFFIPIIKELELRGYRIMVTARDAFQVSELAAQSGLSYAKIGRHYGKNRILKLLGLLLRSLELLPFALMSKPNMALSHGARSQLLLANVLKIPTVLILDYEHTKSPPLCGSKYEIVPEVIRHSQIHGERHFTYTGIKEDVYAPSLKPDSSLLAELGISQADLLITLRPPATEAHYHNPESEILFREFVKWALNTNSARIVLLPRNAKQGRAIRQENPEWFTDSRVTIPINALNGMNLLWHSDLVVSGGGTMNREAAALNVPVYSIFRGPIGAVDRNLAAEGRLVLIESVDDIRKKIKLVKRTKGSSVDAAPRPALQQIVSHIEDILKQEEKL